MRILKGLSVVAAVFASIAIPCSAKSKPPVGILAASVNDSVVLADPSSGRTLEVDTGPVGWLYPAPGGILFAPDVIHGRTTVINLRTLSVAERMDGLTMPHFGDNPDRYVALPGDVLVLSYPDRALITKISATIAHPWQVVVSPDGGAMVILERLPDGGNAHISAVNLTSRQVVYRRPLDRDIVHMALSSKLGLLALADPDASTVHLAEPSTLTPVATRATEGRPKDLTFSRDEEMLATALDTGGDGGALELALFKRSKKKGLYVAKEHTVPLPATPLRVDASPDGRYVAVALADGTVAIVDVDDRSVAASHRLPGVPRDLRWCDPGREGPTVPEWSDGSPETPGFEPFVPKVRDGSSSGLTPP